MKLTSAALSASRLTFFVALLILVTGTFAFLTFPSQEEPSVTIRDAMVYVVNPGMSSERMEQLVARPLEESIRQINELKTITSTVRAGSVIVQVTLRDEINDLLPVWQKMRAKIDEVAPTLPSGTLPPVINDDFGRVAVASIAVTAQGFSMSEMREPLRQLRDGLYGLPGIQSVTFHGLQSERIYIEFDRARLAGLGLSLSHVLQQLQQQNIVASAGQAVISGINAAIVASGELRSLQELENLIISVPGTKDKSDTVPVRIRLADVARVRVLMPDPPESKAIFNGENAVVIGVSMQSGQNIKKIGQAIQDRLSELEKQLPAGFSINYVTFQANVVKTEMAKMNQVMLETVVIVMIVVVIFLGWRAGIVVGSIVPLTILATLLAMRSLSIELHTVSMAAIIIALGLLVDNGIVIAEDIERRLSIGEDRRNACIDAGRTLAIPLLTSSLVIIFAFSPFFFGNTATNEYLRPLVIVLTITLLGSWVICLTVTPLLCYRFLKHQNHNNEPATQDHGFYAYYAKTIRAVLDHKKIFICTMLLVLMGSLGVLGTRPAGFLPPSDRPQFQIALELPPGSDTRNTEKIVRELSTWLSDQKINPEVATNIGYVAEGGPRVVLVLNPPLPASHIGYFTVTVKSSKDLRAVMMRTREWVSNNFPEVHVDVKYFSRSAHDSGSVAYRIVGPDENVLREISGKIQDVLRDLPGLTQVRDDWGPRVPRIQVRINQEKARSVGVSTDDISTALATRYSGQTVSILRDGDTQVPIIVRGNDSERTNPEDLANTPIFTANGSSVPLSAIANMEVVSEPSSITRRNMSRVVTVKGRNTQGTAQQVITAATPMIASISIPPGYRIEIGAEIEEAAESNLALEEYLPHAAVAMLILFLWQFRSFRKVALIVGIIPFAMIGAGPALLISGEPLSFMATFGLLSLAGIIVNNAVLLLERIEVELALGKSRREAVVAAAVARLRPIVMTKLTCVVGLIPLLLFAGTLWSGMAVTIMGGLLVGTLITLGLVPVLYDFMFDERFSKLSKRTFGDLEA